MQCNVKEIVSVFKEYTLPNCFRNSLILSGAIYYLFISEDASQFTATEKGELSTQPLLVNVSECHESLSIRIISCLCPFIADSKKI